MTETINKVIDFLQDKVKINNDSLKAYDPSPLEDNNQDAEVKRYREIQAIILQDRINELNSNVAFIKRIYADG